MGRDPGVLGLGMRKALGVLACLVVLGGCGSSGRSFGQADEDWCSAHWPKDQQTRCFNTILHAGPSFLESIESQEHIAAEIAGIRAFHP